MSHFPSPVTLVQSRLGILSESTSLARLLNLFQRATPKMATVCFWIPFQPKSTPETSSSVQNAVQRLAGAGARNKSPLRRNMSHQLRAIQGDGGAGQPTRVAVLEYQCFARMKRKAERQTTVLGGKALNFPPKPSKARNQVRNKSMSQRETP